MIRRREMSIRLGGTDRGRLGQVLRYRAEVPVARRLMTRCGPSAPRSGIPPDRSRSGGLRALDGLKLGQRQGTGSKPITVTQHGYVPVKYHIGPLCNTATGWNSCENGLATHALAVPTDNQHRLIIPITQKQARSRAVIRAKALIPGAMARAQAQAQPFSLQPLATTMDVGS